jgi:hypothetical protein
VSPQLNDVIADLRAAQRRLHALHVTVRCEEWTRRPGAGSWSPVECVAHLNLTSEALLPRLRAGLDEASCAAGRQSRYRRDPVGWVIWKAFAPTGRLRTRTIPAFEPSGDQPAEAVIADFERLQSEVIACVEAANGLPLDRVKLVSPFTDRLRYNLYAALTLVPRHQHRHLLQAERAAAAVSAPAAVSALAAV